jgi:hypothetical protein
MSVKWKKKSPESKGDRKTGTMKELTCLFSIAIIFSLFVGCGPKPRVQYLTEHGFNVYCDSKTQCYDKDQIEKATDLVIDELVWRVGEPYTYKRIYDFLEDFSGWNEIYVLEEKVGEKGSCATEKDPDRACRGFECPNTISPSGWCAGTHWVRKFCQKNNCIEYSEMKVIKKDCISTCALVHELIHFFQYYIGGQFHDYHHETVPLWSGACTEELYPDVDDRKECKRTSVKRQANWNLCKEYCGDLCKEN